MPRSPARPVWSTHSRCPHGPHRWQVPLRAMTIAGGPPSAEGRRRRPPRAPDFGRARSERGRSLRRSSAPSHTFGVDRIPRGPCPAPSTRRAARPTVRVSPSTRSRVVPGLGETIARSRPRRAFRRLDSRHSARLRASLSVPPSTIRPRRALVSKRASRAQSLRPAPGNRTGTIRPRPRGSRATPRGRPPGRGGDPARRALHATRPRPAHRQSSRASVLAPISRATASAWRRSRRPLRRRAA